MRLSIWAHMACSSDTLIVWFEAACIMSDLAKERMLWTVTFAGTIGGGRLANGASAENEEGLDNLGFVNGACPSGRRGTDEEAAGGTDAAAPTQW